MSRKSYPNVNAANQYARDVVRGKIVACQFVIQACQRHLDDLMAEKSKSFRYRFDKDLAERAAKFIQLLPHTKGEWAFKRMPITLEPWQLFVICCAFGWVNKGTRLRRFREVYTEIPRKNGKSAISAGVALYCFACDTAIMGALALPVKSAITLESKMADVRKVVDGLDTPDAFKAMTEQVRALSTELPMSADGIAEIVAAGGQAGIARDELMQFATDAVKMGVAFDTTAEESGQMMAQWRTAFNMTQDEVAGLADKINYLGNTGPANAKKISDIVTRIGPLGGVAGVASGEIAAMGATIAGMGVESEIAATGIKNFMLSLTAGNSATKSQKQALRFLRINPKKLAADMQKDARGTMLSVLDAMAKVPKEKQAAVLNALFGKESLGAIAPLLTNLDLLRTNFRRVADSQQYGSSMQKEYASRAATTENQLLLLQNQLDAISSTLGETFLPEVNDGLEAVKPLLEEVRTFVRENPELVKTIAKIGLALLTVGAAAGSLSRIMKVLGGVMNMTPAKGLIALLVGGAYLIIDNWETVGPVIKKVWHVVDETAQAMGGWETVLKAIALFIATKWVADVTKSITAVTREMRTL
ncbi:phage tail tape measure protein, partial [Escherichia coli]